MQGKGLPTMMLLGPTESIVIADSSADAKRVAADLLIEAEHGTDSSVLLVSDSVSLIDASLRFGRLRRVHRWA
jgi:histidinol dehydrogenase